MTVPELRKAIIAHSECFPSSTANGKPVYRMPDGSLLSKAKKTALVTYLADLDNLKTAAEVIEATDSVNPPVPYSGDLNEIERTIARCDRKIRKYAKRRQSPGNVASGDKWKAKRARLAAQLAGATLTMKKAA